MAEPSVVQGAVMAEQAMRGLPAQGLEASRPPMLSPPAAPGANLNVLVPAGAAAGQRVEFTAPGGQRLVVVLEQDVAPGSMVGVSAPASEVAVAQAQASAVTMQAAPAGSPGSTQLVNGVIIRPQGVGGLPQLEVRADEIEANQDRKAACIGWVLYGAGWLFLFTCGLFAIVPWMVIAGLYYCKTPEQRSRNRRQKGPACASLITCSVVCACLMAVAVAMGIHMLSHTGCYDGPHHHHHHPHHGGHHRPGPLRSILHRAHHAWHHHHCPHSDHPGQHHGWHHDDHPGQHHGWHGDTGPHHGPHRTPPADVPAETFAEAHSEESPTPAEAKAVLEAEGAHTATGGSSYAAKDDDAEEEVEEEAEEQDKHEAEETEEDEEEAEEHDKDESEEAEDDEEEDQKEEAMEKVRRSSRGRADQVPVHI